MRADTALGRSGHRRTTEKWILTDKSLYFTGTEWAVVQVTEIDRYDGIYLFALGIWCSG